jgi:hypothetical protein
MTVAMTVSSLPLLLPPPERWLSVVGVADEV